MRNKLLPILIILVIFPIAVFATRSNPYPKCEAESNQSYSDISSDKNKQNVSDFANAVNNAFAVPGSICSLKPAQLDEIIKDKGQALESSRALSDVIKNSDVVIAGEMHLFTDLKARNDVISKFADLKGTNSCVVFELPQTTDGLDSFMNSLKEAEKKSRADGNTVLANERKDLIQYYDTMISFAKSKGVKVFGVDHPENFQKDLSNPVRNKAIAGNIGKLIDQKSCSSVLLFVGKAHETKASESNDPAISTLLKKKPVKVSTLNIQMTNENSIAGQLRTWDLCNEPKNLATTTVLKSTDLPEGTKIAPRSGEETKFSDFDLTLLVPHSQKDFPCSSCYKN